MRTLRLVELTSKPRLTQKGGLPVRCGATKELKPLRKSLERKQKEIQDATIALQSSTCLDTPLALHGMVLHLQVDNFRAYPAT
jgi:hypothetical protein